MEAQGDGYREGYAYVRQGNGSELFQMFHGRVMDRQDWRALIDAIYPFIPPSIGAFFGLKHSIERTKREAVTSWFCSAVIGLLLAQGAAEFWDLGRAATSGLSILFAMFLSDMMAVVLAALKQAAADPAANFRRWLDAVLGRRGEP